jgi:predicted nucleic acid-binding protein
VRVLVDTNVLLDVLAKRVPFLASSAAVWALAETNQIEAVVCALTFSNLYYIARKSNGHGPAMDAVRAVARDFRIAPVDDQIIAQAVGSTMPDFEDAIQLFSGIRAGVSHIITRDSQGFSSGSLPTLSPAELVARVSRSANP